MFWSLILPFQITFVAITAVSALAMVYALRRKWKLLRSALTIGLLGAIAFVPSCVVLDVVTSPFRFRSFHYADYSNIGDERFLQCLPPGASDITVHNSRNGFSAAFTIEQTHLDAWYSGVLRKTRSFVEHPGRPPVEKGPDQLFYEGPRAGNWAGFDVRYYTKTRLATVETADW